MIGLGMQELIVILIIVAILFGATRLPELGRGIGQAVRNYRKGMSELNEVKKDVSDLGKIDVTKTEEDASKKEGEEKREEAKKEEQKEGEVNRSDKLV